MATMISAAPLSVGAEAVRQTRERYKKRGLRQINTTLDETHTQLFAELVENCDGYATKRTIQEALSLLHKVRIGQAVISEKR